MPPTKLLSKLYSGNYEFRVDDKANARFIEMASKVIFKLKKIYSDGVSLLDIGAGYGSFVHVATSNGLDAVGIEPANNLYNFALRTLKKRIINIDLNNFTKTTNKRFDFITAIHVIEHVKDPNEFLENCIKLLNPNGTLFIETPNSWSHLTLAEKANYTFLTPPDHTNLFSELSLKHMLNNVDAKLESEFYSYSYPEHLVGILRALKHRNKRYYLSKDGNIKKRVLTIVKDGGRLPFFDRVVAPIFTPLLNIGNMGSFLQVFIQKTY